MRKDLYYPHTPVTCYTPIHVSSSLYIVQCIHYYVLGLEERIVVDLLLSTWKHLVLMCLNPQVYQDKVYTKMCQGLVYTTALMW